MSNKKTFNINPGTGIMDVLGHTGYSFNEAIADILDNSISSGASTIDIYFSFKENNEFLYILDNGNGMNFDELKSAAKIGDKDLSDERTETDLGRFSTGLKSATRSFCDNVIISSKKRNKKINTINIDYKHIKESGRWEAFELNDFKYEDKIKDSGTLIYCDNLLTINSKLNEKELYKKIGSLQTSLSHVFGMFLIENKLKINIQVNNSKKNEVIGWNPFDLLENKTTRSIYSDVKRLNGKEVKIKTYILPTFDNLSTIDQDYMKGNGLTNQEGFYIYRNNRLIVDGGWLSLEGLSYDDKARYARIRVDYPSSLDEEFKINFSKTNIIVPEELKATFLNVAKQARKESRQNFNYQKHPEIKRRLKKHEEENLWNSTKNNGALVFSLNYKHPLIKQMLPSLSDGELKRMCNLISKSLPISLIQGQEATTVEYTESELIDYMNETYNNLKNSGLDKDEIKKKMAHTEPFNEHLDLLVEFFESRGE